MDHTLIEDATGRVVNVITLDDPENYSAESGFSIGPAGGQIGDIWNGVSYSTPAPEISEHLITLGYEDWSNPGALEDARAFKVAEIQRCFDTKSVAHISFTLEDATTHDFHADSAAIENILGVVTMINAGVPVPNPRTWTPVGSLTPVNMTHNDLIGLGAAIAARKDALFIYKKTLEAQIAAETDGDTIMQLDVTTGWPTS